MVEAKSVKKIAQEFGLDSPSIEPIGSGIIHHTFKAETEDQSIVLQQINTNVFTKPEALIDNYLLVHRYLQDTGRIRIPEPVESLSGDWLVRDEEGSYWRATEFIRNTYSPDSAHDSKAAYTTAACFGSFTKSLQGINISQLDVVIADFHDLSFRSQQFEDAILKAELFKAMRATHVIAELRQRKYLVDFYHSIKNNPSFPLRLMHHDCKIGNILFDRTTHEVICPIDLDTIMPGKYFSDLGDMVRTMACTENEESRKWELIDIRKEFYNAIINGYLNGIGDVFTPEEKEQIHKSGLMMIYMQAIRFITDFLEGDRYYKTTYPEQNLNRALNQLILLEKLEEFLWDRPGSDEN
jgi:Phosphotransferase enzyme family